MSLCCCFGEPEWSDGEVEDDDAVNLSHVGQAAYEVLRKRHYMQHHSLWNVTSGQVMGELHQTPNKLEWDGTKDPDAHHSDYFPIKMAEIMARTERWCDVMSLSPPDGLFMTQMQEALQVICDRAAVQEKKITIRMMFGNIVGMPVNCTAGEFVARVCVCILLVNTGQLNRISSWYLSISSLQSFANSPKICQKIQTFACGWVPGARACRGTTPNSSRWTGSTSTPEDTTCGTSTICSSTPSTISRSSSKCVTAVRSREEILLSIDRMK